MKWLAALSLGLLAPLACSASAAPSRPEDVTVFAAASLTESFNALAKAFDSASPGQRVRTNYGGSSMLVQQILQGARADVFASADAGNMQKLAQSDAVEAPTVFAHNKLEIAVQRGNPKHIEGLADLTRPGVVVVLAAPGVPAGNYAVQALHDARLEVKPQSLELDVKAVLTKVALGEADAGIVYVTDVKAAGGSIEGVAIPDDQNVVATYPLAVLRSAPNPAGARAFERFVLSEPGQRVLASYGFLRP